MPLVPFPAWKPDVIDYEGSTSLTISGVVPRADGYGPVPAPIAYSQPLPAACRGAFVAWKNDGSIVAFAGTTTKLYQLSNSTQAWTDVSNILVGTGHTGGSYTALPTTDYWTFVQFNNLVIACQANTTPQYFNIVTSTTFLDLSAFPATPPFTGALGTPPNAKYVSIVGRFVVLSGITSGTGSMANASPYRVAWSDLNAPATWDGSGASDFQDLPDGGVVRGIAGGESGIILQDNAIRKMTYTQEATLVFQIERISQERGLYAPYSLTRAGEMLFFVASSGLFNMIPGGLPSEIGKAKFNRTFMNDLDRATLQLGAAPSLNPIGAADPRQSRLLLAYKSIRSSTIGNFDTLLCYDFLLDRATTIPLAGEYILYMAQGSANLDTPLTANIDTFGMSFDSFGAALTPELAMFDTSHRLAFFRGGPLEAILDTPEQGTDGTRLRVRSFRPITDAPTVFGALLKRETAQAAPTTTTESAVNAVGICPQNYSTRYARGRVRIPAGTAWTYAVGVEPDFSLEGAK